MFHKLIADVLRISVLDWTDAGEAGFLTPQAPHPSLIEVFNTIPPILLGPFSGLESFTDEEYAAEGHEIESLLQEKGLCHADGLHKLGRLMSQHPIAKSFLMAGKQTLPEDIFGTCALHRALSQKLKPLNHDSKAAARWHVDGIHDNFPSFDPVIPPEWEEWTAMRMIGFAGRSPTQGIAARNIKAIPNRTFGGRINRYDAVLSNLEGKVDDRYIYTQPSGSMLLFPESFIHRALYDSPEEEAWRFFMGGVLAIPHSWIESIQQLAGIFTATSRHG